jgi:hypothetical protein
MPKFLRFLGVVVTDVVALMSGAAGFALGLLARYWNAPEVPARWLWTASVVCLFIAMFRAWSKEYDRAEKQRSAPLPDSVLYRQYMELRQEHQKLRDDLGTLKRTPRKLTEAQRKIVKGALANVVQEFLTLDEHKRRYSVGLRWNPRSVDAEAFALDIADALEDSGMIVRENRCGPISADEAVMYATGIHIRKRNDLWQPFYGEYDKALTEAFEEAGLSPTLEDSGLGLSAVEIVVGG